MACDVPPVGSLVRQPVWSSTFRAILDVETRQKAHGREAALQACLDAFYRGRVAEDIATFARDGKVADEYGRVHGGLSRAPTSPTIERASSRRSPWGTGAWTSTSVRRGARVRSSCSNLRYSRDSTLRHSGTTARRLCMAGIQRARRCPLGADFGARQIVQRRRRSRGTGVTRRRAAGDHQIVDGGPACRHRADGPHARAGRRGRARQCRGRQRFADGRGRSGGDR